MNSRKKHSGTGSYVKGSSGKGSSNVVDIRHREYRTIWVSDVHLGTKGCKADLLLDFLKSVNAEYLYLVGDIVDLWSMSSTTT